MWGDALRRVRALSGRCWCTVGALMLLAPPLCPPPSPDRSSASIAPPTSYISLAPSTPASLCVCSPASPHFVPPHSQRSGSVHRLPVSDHGDQLSGMLSVLCPLVPPCAHASSRTGLSGGEPVFSPTSASTQPWATGSQPASRRSSLSLRKTSRWTLPRPPKPSLMSS